MSEPKLTLAASQGPESGMLLLDQVRVNGAPLTMPSRSQRAYSLPLLLLFAEYGLWGEEGRPPAEFKFGGPKCYEAEVESLADLLHNNKRREHWGDPLLKSEGTSALLLQLTRGQQSLTVASERLAPQDVRLMFCGKTVAGRDNLRVLINLLRLSQEADGASPLRFAGLRENLDYRVDFRDDTSRTELGSTLRLADYHFFKATLSFERVALRPLEQFSIGLIEAGADLAEDISRVPQGVIYREVYSVLPRDRDSFRQALERAQEASPQDRQRLLDRAIPVTARVEGREACLTRIERQPWGHYLIFELPPEQQGLFRLRFELSVEGFQPRDRLSFPIVVSEPTRRARFQFFYGESAIDNIDSFIGLRVAPDGSRPRVEMSRANRIFSFAREDDFFLMPGEGAGVFWAPPQRVERVCLVNLRDVDRRLIVAPRYATTDNPLGKQLYPISQLFLAEGPADRLRRVLRRLVEDGYVLQIWDAYRPPSVQRQIAQWLRQHAAPESRVDPERGGAHTRGCAVDVTLLRLDGSAVPMPTDFGDLTERASRAAIAKADTLEARNARLLAEVMKDEGFLGLESEWFHYDDPDWRRYPILDLEPYDAALRHLTEG